MSRYSIVFSEKYEKLFERIEASSGLKKANAIRTALAVFDVLLQETKNPNKQIAIIDENNSIIKVVVIPQ